MQLAVMASTRYHGPAVPPLMPDVSPMLCAYQASGAAATWLHGCAGNHAVNRPCLRDVTPRTGAFAGAARSPGLYPAWTRRRQRGNHDDRPAHCAVSTHGDAVTAELELASWRRDISELYAAVRAEDKPERGHALWRSRRDELFRTHPQSPLPPADPLRAGGLPYWPYDPDLRFELPVRPVPAPSRLSLPTDGDGTTSLRLVGRVELPSPVAAAV